MMGLVRRGGGKSGIGGRIIIVLKFGSFGGRGELMKLSG